MKLDNNYSVHNDGTQWILSYEKVTDKINPKTGKFKVSRDQWFHNRLKDSIASYIDKKLKSKETVDETILELKKLLQEARDLEFIN